MRAQCKDSPINQPYTLKHDHTRHFSSSAQLRYHSVTFILIDRHCIEPLANFEPDLEELDMLAFWG